MWGIAAGLRRRKTAGSNGRRLLAKLAAITRNFTAAGAQTLVMSGVVETANGVDKYPMAIGACH